MHRTTTACRVVLPCCLLLVACDGGLQIDPGTSGTPESPPGSIEREEPAPVAEVCDRIDPGATPLRRLTTREYNRTVQTLFPQLELEPYELATDETIGAFEANTVASVDDGIAVRYRESAESISSKFAARIGEVLPCASTSDEQIYRGEAETIGSSVGQEAGDYWLVWSNGEVASTFTVEVAGMHRIAVRAYGSRAGDELPRMRVSLDGREVEVFEVDALRDAPVVYEVDTEIGVGTHTLSAAFVNDHVDADGNDRNIWVDYLDVTATGRADIEDACARSFVRDFGPRAFRRPLTDSEEQRLFALYRWGVDSGYGGVEGLRAVIEGALQSPKFLYRFEVGASSDQPVVALTDHELAARLSYLLWDTMPDAELMRAAEAGELSDAAGIERQARRMLEDPRAREAINRALLRLLHLDDFEDFERPEAEFTPEMVASMRAETLAFIDHVIWEDDGSIATLLTAPYTFVDARTAELYGLEAPEGDGLVRVELDGERRLGILTQPAVLARHGYGQVPVHRGKFVRDTFLCAPTPPPPNELIDPPETFPEQSMRSRVEGRLEHGGCSGCHAQMDPIGLAFDTYDTMGRYQTVDAHGNSLHDSGEILGTPATDGSVDGAVALAHRLAASEDVRSCVARQWFRYAFARMSSAADSGSNVDACSLAVMEKALRESEGDILELFVAMTTTDAFRYRRALPKE